MPNVVRNFINKLKKTKRNKRNNRNNRRSTSASARRSTSASARRSTSASARRSTSARIGLSDTNSEIMKNINNCLKKMKDVKPRIPKYGSKKTIGNKPTDEQLDSWIGICFRDELDNKPMNSNENEWKGFDKENRKKLLKDWDIADKLRYELYISSNTYKPEEINKTISPTDQDNIQHVRNRLMPNFKYPSADETYCV
jgi:hypothetical protein